MRQCAAALCGRLEQRTRAPDAASPWRCTPDGALAVDPPHRSRPGQLERRFCSGERPVVGRDGCARGRVSASAGSRATALPLPTVAVGNLSVGGSGKTPIAAWIASILRRANRRVPAILLRGVGDDETARAPRACAWRRGDCRTPIAAPERSTAVAARRAVCWCSMMHYQRMDVARDLDICLVSAESSQAVRWSLPAGPWREGIAGTCGAPVSWS